MNHLQYRGEGRQVYLRPGELYLGSEPSVVTTVLGSCVSVTLLHKVTGIAAICHTLQPSCPNPELCFPNCQARHRYTVCTIEKMSRYMLSHGLRPRDIEVKLFGGAALIGTLTKERIATSIGHQNVKAAMETIDKCGLMLKVMDVGGNFGRKIIFNTSTGEVFMKRLQRISLPGRES